MIILFWNQRHHYLFLLIFYSPTNYFVIYFMFDLPRQPPRYFIFIIFYQPLYNSKFWLFFFRTVGGHVRHTKIAFRKVPTGDTCPAMLMRFYSIFMFVKFFFYVYLSSADGSVYIDAGIFIIIVLFILIY